MVYRLLDGAAPVDFSPLKTALLGTVTPAQLIAIIAGVVGVGMTFFLVWLGIKKLTRAFQTSVEKGHLNI